MNTAIIEYSTTRKVSLFSHIDFMNRWFRGLLDLSKIPDKRGNFVVTTEGIKFIFRYAKFYNFNKVESGKPLLVCYRADTSEFWIMNPKWLVETKNLRDSGIDSYQGIINSLSLFHSEGNLIKQLIAKKRIVEINK